MRKVLIKFGPLFFFTPLPVRAIDGMRKLRKGITLGDDLTIRELIDKGRRSCQILSLMRRWHSRGALLMKPRIIPMKYKHLQSSSRGSAA